MRVGLAGAGPWAQMFHAPMLARSEDVELVGIWARRPEAAQVLAERRHCAAYADFDALLDDVDALALAVPPDVQVDLGVRAASRGCHLLLEKPLGLDLAGAERLAEAVAGAGVRSQMVLTRRYTPAVRELLAEAGRRRLVGGRAAAISGAVVDGGPFATPWRLDHGSLLDVGPHVIDLLDAALGPVVNIDARGERRGLVILSMEHDGGAVSQAALSIAQPVASSIWDFELYGPDGVLTPSAGAEAPEQYATALRTIPAEWAECVRQGGEHPLNAARGLHLQRILDRASRRLG